VSDPSRTVTLAKEQGRATIRLSRGSGNAINDQVLDELVEALDEAENEPEIRGVILSAEGKMFCPGLDLHYLSRLDRGGESGSSWLDSPPAT